MSGSQERLLSLGSTIIANKGGGSSVIVRPSKGGHVASLRVMIYDLAIQGKPCLPSKFPSLALNFCIPQPLLCLAGCPRPSKEPATCDKDFQYGCTVALGALPLLPDHVAIPLPTLSTCLCSHINLYVIPHFCTLHTHKRAERRKEKWEQ